MRIVSSGLAIGVLVLMGCGVHHARSRPKVCGEIVREDVVKITEAEAFRDAPVPAPVGQRRYVVVRKVGTASDR